MIDIAILTDPRYVIHSSKDPYISNVLYEDKLVEDALKKEGFSTQKVAWSDKKHDWSTVEYALFRTTWDYFDRFDQFLPWLNASAKLTTFINSYNLISWNLDKHYLRELYQSGINTIPTEYCKQNEDYSLREITKKNGWEKLVIKPTVSGAAKDTFLISSDEVSNKQVLFDALLEKQSMMVQEAQTFILEKGEFSLVMIGLEFSHAVLKVAKKGDFRVQDDFGGTVHDYNPTLKEIEFARRALQACPELPIYARVDMIYDNKGHLAIVELELIEPELWFRKVPSAATRLAIALKERLL